MISSINLYSQLYFAAQAPAQPAQDKTPGVKSCRREAEPGGAEADRTLGKEVTEAHYQLSRIKVEDSLTTEQLEEVVRALAGTLPNPDPKGQPIKVPLNAVYNNARSGRDDLWQRQPALKFIFERDQAAHKADCAKPAQGGHRHLYHYFGNPEYWNNAIILLSLLAQKQIEANDRAGILRATQYCRDYKARIARQKTTQQFEPVEYYEAVLDLTQAELMAQVKGKLLVNSLARPGETELNLRLVGELRAYYTKARDQVRDSINTLVGFKDKFFWPSEPDFFSIPKALILLGDLDVKLKEVNRQEIALLRRKDPRSARIGELEKQNLELLETAYTLYSSLQQIDESRGSLAIKINLPGLNLKNFTPDNIKDALAMNTAKGFLEESDRLDALQGIFHLLKAVATLKRVSLLPQITESLLDPKKVFDPKKPDQAFVSDPAGVKTGRLLLEGIRDCNQALDQLAYLLTQMKGKLNQCPPARKLVMQERISKLENGFYFHFGRLVKADMTLGILDRLNFTVLDRRDRPAWENFVATIEALETLKVFEPLGLTGQDKVDLDPRTIKARIKAELSKRVIDIKLIDKQRHNFTRLMVATAEKKYRREDEEIARLPQPKPFQLKNLAAWAEVKLLELAVRSANYLEHDVMGNKRVGKANERIAGAEALKKRWVESAAVPDQLKPLFGASGDPHYLFFQGDPAAAPGGKPELAALWRKAETYFEQDEYLGIELDYLQAIFSTYKYDADLAGTAGAREMTDRLARRVQGYASFLPAEKLVYFNYFSELKKATVLIQHKNFNGAAQLLGGLLTRVNNNPQLPEYLERLSWDIHTLKAELYHQLAVAYSWIERKDKKNPNSLTLQYGKKAFEECKLSTSIYDQVNRPGFIKFDLGFNEYGQAVDEGKGKAARKKEYFGR